MARPTDRESFKNYCLGKLGFPVIKISVTDEQISDRIDDALDRFYEWHFAGHEDQLLPVHLTDTLVNSGVISVDASIISVTECFPFAFSTLLSGTGSAPGSTGAFQYQSFVTDVLGPSSVLSSNLSYLTQVRQFLSQTQKELNPIKSFKFNRNTGKIHMTEDLAYIRQAFAQYLMFRVLVKLDVDANPMAWNEWWLKTYATALIKQQWGENLIKYNFGNVMPGGIGVNGEKIKAEADAEVALLEQQVQDMQTPPMMIIG